VALSPFDSDTLLIGTSYEGFYETTDRGNTWTDPSETAAFLNRGAHFFEEIAAIAYDPVESGVIVFGLGFGHGVFRSNSDRTEYTDLRFPGESEGELIRGLQFLSDKLVVSTDRSVWHRTYSGSWSRKKIGALLEPRHDEPLRRRLEIASRKTGIYISSTTAGNTERLDELLDFVRNEGMNSIVVDFKDDWGYVTYDTRLELPRRMSAVRVRFDVNEIIAKAHARDIYVIARMLVFKDRAMYRYDNHAYAAWDEARKAPWANLLEREDENGKKRLVQLEHWVDPYSEFVWDHNVAIARELEDLGIDEVQFDYIRFPTDGNLARITYRHKRPGMERMDALESFLIKAREALSVPISTDLYGFNSWHRMGHWNGQSIEMVSRYVDVISPMFYPSHFPRDFIGQLSYVDRSRQIYREGTSRASSIVAGRSLIRPYVQAFRIGGELRMSRHEYGAYLRAQLEGASSAPSSGFTLWNASNDYYMVTFPMTDYLPAIPES
jgi:hypothetical protein